MEEKIYKKLDFIAFCCLIFIIKDANVDDILGIISLLAIIVLYFLPLPDFKTGNKLFSFSFTKTDKTDEDHDLDHSQENS